MLAHPNLSAWWRMEGNANDSSGNGNNGTNNGADILDPAVFGKGYEFVSANRDNIYVSSLNNKTTSLFSIGFWIKTSATSGCIISDWLHSLSFPPGYYGWKQLIDANGKLSFVLGTGIATETKTSNNAINNGAWHHVVIKYNNSTPAVGWIIDGVDDGLGGTFTNPMSTSASRRFYIGMSYVDNENIDMKIDEVTLFDISLNINDAKRVMLDMHILR